MNSKTKKILTVIGVILGVVIFALCSILVARASYKASEETERKEQEEIQKSISNLKIADVDKVAELFNSSEVQIVFVGSLTCPHCTGIKPKINELAEELNADIYYFELSTLTEEEEEKFYSVNEFLSQGTSIPLVMAVKDNEVVDSFVGNIEKEEIKSFLTKNLNIK